MKFDPIKMQWKGWIMGVHVTMTDEIKREIEENEASKRAFFEAIDDKWAREQTDIPFIMKEIW